jgi:hypothetical protein
MDQAIGLETNQGIKMTYHTYNISIVSGDSLKFLSVCGVSIQAAIADVKEAYAEGVEIVSISQE